MVSEIEIGPARGSERRALLELWVGLIEHHRKLDPGYPHLSHSEAGLREGLLAEIDRALADSRCTIFVARVAAGDGDELAGFCFAELEPDATAWIHELFVRPAERRRGLGRALVGATLDRLAEQRPAKISVRVESANTEAQQFWHKLAFREHAKILVLSQ